MSVFRELTKEEKSNGLKHKAHIDSVFLADDVMGSLEKGAYEYEVSAIKNTDSFKRFININVRWVWNNELTENEKNYYFQQLHILISTRTEQDQYIDRLIDLATDDVIKRLTDFIDKHKDIQKITVKTPIVKW